MANRNETVDDLQLCRSPWEGLPKPEPIIELGEAYRRARADFANDLLPDPALAKDTYKDGVLLGAEDFEFPKVEFPDFKTVDEVIESAAKEMAADALRSKSDAGMGLVDTMAPMCRSNAPPAIKVTYPGDEMPDDVRQVMEAFSDARSEFAQALPQERATLGGMNPDEPSADKSVRVSEDGWTMHRAGINTTFSKTPKRSKMFWLAKTLIKSSPWIVVALHLVGVLTIGQTLAFANSARVGVTEFVGATGDWNWADHAFAWGTLGTVMIAVGWAGRKWRGDVGFCARDLDEARSSGHATGRRGGYGLVRFSDLSPDEQSAVEERALSRARDDARKEVYADLEHQRAAAKKLGAKAVQDHVVAAIHHVRARKGMDTQIIVPDECQPAVFASIICGALLVNSSIPVRTADGKVAITFTYPKSGAEHSKVAMADQMNADRAEALYGGANI